MGFNFTPRTERIEFGGGNFIELRGLGVTDITTLVATHKDTALNLFAQATGKGPEALTDSDAADFAARLAVTAPTMVAHAIALSADASDRFDDVLKLPIDVMVAAINKIAELTFEMQGGVGSFLQTVLSLSKKLSGAVEEIKNLPRPN